MPKLLVLFDSRTGGTAALAEAVAEGARSVRFMEVDVRRVGDGPDDAPEGRRHRVLDAPAQAADYDAIVLGAHVADGAMPTLEAVLGRLQGAGRTGAFTNKVASAFASAVPSASAGGVGDGARRALLSLVEPMAALGMIVVPPGHADPSASDGTPLGATSAGDRPTEAELAAARHQGRRVALVADWVTHGLGHMQGPAHGHSHGHGHSHAHGGHHH